MFLLLLLLSGEESRATYSSLPTTGCDGRAHMLFAPLYPIYIYSFINQLPLLRGTILVAVTIGLLLLTEWTRVTIYLEEPLLSFVL